MLGLALGDAVGAPFEFRRSADVPRPVPALELGWRGGSPGSTTDDTALARNLVRSLGERGEFDPVDLTDRHVRWFRSGPPDVGTLTRLVLERVERGERAPDAARSVWEQRGPEVSAGNGSVMYCAPLGAAYARRPHELALLAGELSALTHHDRRCRTACVAVTLVCAALVRGDDPHQALRNAVSATIDLEGGEELEFLVEAAGSTRPVDGPDQGFCLFTSGLALQAIAREDRFPDAVARIVSLGGDTDTNAAVAGALLGARDGATLLPEEWLERLLDRDAIEEEARALVPLAARE